MAVKTLDEFKDIFASGDFTPDSMLELAEDVADTLNDFTAKLAAAEAATAKIEKEWREKYTSRFFEGKPEGSKPDEPEDATERAEHITFNDLFK
jgi:roadblock/LC7 domain-containing protein